MGMNYCEKIFKRFIMKYMEKEKQYLAIGPLSWGRLGVTRWVSG
jgi:hypothetical protein